MDARRRRFCGTIDLGGALCSYGLLRPRSGQGDHVNDNQAPVGLRRALLRARAYLQFGLWVAKEMNPWRKSYGKRP